MPYNEKRKQANEFERYNIENRRDPTFISLKAKTENGSVNK